MTSPQNGSETPAEAPPGRLDHHAFETYLNKTRWFAGKGRPYAVTDVRAVGELPDPAPEGPRVVVHVVEVTYDDTTGDAAGDAAEDRVELYQVPLSYYTHPETRIDHAFIGWWEDPEHGWVHAYDALHDREAMACWLRAFDRAADGATGASPGASPGAEGLTFHRLPGHRLDVTATSTLFSGEQSNSSVRFGEDALMKVFRKVTPGRNPDISVHDVLTRAGSEHIARLYGWAELTGQDGEVVQLAMLQEYLRTGTDGWDLALSSVRNLFAEPELHAHDVGGDFAGEATRLGDALREVHEVLAQHFPAESRPGDSAAALADQMGARLDAAVRVVPELAQHADALRGLHRRVAELDAVEVQQVHGDLHLGQTLRTSQGWKLVDFEGEPAKPLAERALPDSRWRDVAGMLRSFDYAPHVVQRTLDQGDAEEDARRSVQADEWSHRNKNHFLVAYAGGEVSSEQRVLLNAYLADKAVYECVYETRNRPTWVAIPLEAVARIGGA